MPTLLADHCVNMRNLSRHCIWSSAELQRLDFAADSAAADVAAEEAAAAEPAGAASAEAAAGGERRPALGAASPPKPIKAAPAEHAATGIVTSPSSAPHESLTPMVGYNAQQADKDSASAYAVTALADATVAGAEGAAGGAAQQQAAPAAQDSAAAEAVDWEKVAEQADSHPAATALQPQGSVARLRAIFEQQTGYGPLRALTGPLAKLPSAQQY